MSSNVITFAARKARAANDDRNLRPAPPSALRDNVILLTSWINRAMPRRTPNGVFFTTRVLMTTGEIA